MSTVKDLDWKYTFNEPYEYPYRHRVDNWHAAYPTPDIQFIIFEPADIDLKVQSAMTVYSDNGPIILAANTDIRLKPDRTLYDLGLRFVQVGTLVTNPDSGVMIAVNEFPPVIELEVAA